MNILKPPPVQYYDCDTEFRLAWVQQKFIENQVGGGESKQGP